MNSKKSFLLMRDLLATVDLMTDEEAGQLFKSIIKHVDGENSELPRDLQFAFIPIRNQLDRDNEKWEAKREILRKNASKGGKASASKRKQKEANATKSKQIERVTDNATVTVTATVNEKQKKGRFTPPSLEELKAYIKEKNLNVGAETFINHYETNGWKVGKNKMVSWRHAACNWSKRNNEQNKDERESSEKKWQDSATGIREKGKEVNLRESDFDGFPQFKNAVMSEVRRLENVR